MRIHSLLNRVSRHNYVKYTRSLVLLCVQSNQLPHYPNLCEDSVRTASSVYVDNPRGPRQSGIRAQVLLRFTDSDIRVQRFTDIQSEWTK